MSSLAIIVPCYKQSKYIDQCIKSILACSPPPDQIIASANHCPDGGEAILSKYSGLIQVVSPSRHLPTNEHFNFLASFSTCAFTSLVCADDYVKSNYVGVLSCLANRNPGASIVRAAYSVVDGKSKITRRASLLTSLVVHGGVPPISFSGIKPYPFNFIESCGGSIVPMLSWAFNTAKFTDCNLFSTSIDISDWQAFLALSLHGPFVTSHKQIAFYRANYRPIDQVLRRRARKQLIDSIAIGRDMIMPILLDLDVSLRRRAIARYKRKLAEVASQYQQYLHRSGDSPDCELLKQYDLTKASLLDL
jgi:glycosyltransferase involved in cell wall biosynthesis